MALFKNKYSLGIDFGSSSVKIVEGKFSKKGISINNHFNIDINEDIYRDGKILNIHSMSELLVEGLKGHKISSDRANSVINSSNIITRLISVPNVGFEEIESMLKYQLDEYIPISSEDYIVQFIALDSFYDEGVEKINLLLIGMPKTLIEAHFGLISNGGLKAEVLDFQSNSITKLINIGGIINNNHPTKERNIASLDIGFEKTKLSLIEDGMIKLSRVIDFGTINILDRVGLQLNLGMEEARKKLLEIKDLDKEVEDNHQILDIIHLELRNLIEQLEMIFRYYITRSAQNNIDLLLLQGGINYIEGLNQIFTDFLNLPTERLEKLDGLQFDGPLWDYANAIGSLIRKGDMKL